jgi:formylglycine-generating enzyme required for sulfatase activity
VGSHSVRISQGFFLGDTEVTVKQFRVFVKSTNFVTDAEQPNSNVNGYDPIRKVFFTPGKKAAFTTGKFDWKQTGFDQSEDHPVCNVSFRDAQAFIGWLSKADGIQYRLPTENEWEYACRASTETSFWFSDDISRLCEHDNVQDQSFGRQVDSIHYNAADDGFAFTSPVKHFKPNPFGLYGMHGNVSEWCVDEMTRIPSRYSKGNPLNLRVIRGGNFFDNVHTSLSGARDSRPASAAFPTCGFRIACDK